MRVGVVGVGDGGAELGVGGSLLRTHQQSQFKVDVGAVEPGAIGVPSELDI